MDRQRLEYVQCCAITALFLLALGMPLLGTLSNRSADISHTEQRPLARPPDWPRTLAAARQWPESVSDWLDDHFGLRETLVRLNRGIVRLARPGALATAPVLEGLDGWLYFSGDRTLEDFQGRMPLTREELDAWAEVLVQKQHWLESRGIPYLFIIAPNKQSIYPEYLPPWLAARRGETRADQLVRHLKTHTDVAVLDLRPGLLSRKGKTTLYRRLDSHWNMRGAAAARTLVLEALHEHAPALELAPVPRGTWRRQEIGGGDLARMLGRDQDTEIVPIWRIVEQRCRLNLTRLDERQIGAGELLLDECTGAGVDALVFRDSFMNRLRPLLTPLFRRTFYVWQRADPCLLQRIAGERAPDLVIEQTLERNLVLPPPTCPAD